jgi:hypothetical protein
MGTAISTASRADNKLKKNNMKVVLSQKNILSLEEYVIIHYVWSLSKRKITNGAMEMELQATAMPFYYRRGGVSLICW